MEIGYDAGDRCEPEYPEHLADHEHEWMAWRHVDADRFITDTIMFFNCRDPDCNKRLKVSDVEAMLNEHAKLKRVRDAAQKWHDCAVYDEGNDTWTVFEKDDEYHKLYVALADTQEKTP